MTSKERSKDLKIQEKNSDYSFCNVKQTSSTRSQTITNTISCRMKPCEPTIRTLILTAPDLLLFYYNKNNYIYQLC